MEKSVLSDGGHTSVIITDDKTSPDGDATDVFVEKPHHDFHYKTLTWPFVSLLMIAEIVSNGMLSLPSSLAVVGIVPGVVLIVFLGAFGLFTAKLLVDFKLNHPNVHSMADAGMIMGGPILREILSIGTVIFAICATGALLLSGQQALSSLSNNGLCAMYFLLIFSVATLILAMPRTLDKLRWLGLLSVALIALAGILAMIAAGLNPTKGRTISATVPTTFYQAFLAITNPVFAYAGMILDLFTVFDRMTFIDLYLGARFFVLISEMENPDDAMKAAWYLQVFATAFYTLFAVIIYVYIGDTVQSPALFSLPTKWAKVTWGIALPNFLIAGGLYSHTAAKLVFVRLFRHSKHVYEHTFLGWSVWTILCLIAVALAFILAISVPIFSYLIGISAALFASWYTYGIAGFFWWYDTVQFEGRMGLYRRPVMSIVSILTILAGGFICVAGTYVSIKLITVAYATHIVGKPFSC